MAWHEIQRVPPGGDPSRIVQGVEVLLVWRLEDGSDEARSKWALELHGDDNLHI